MQAGKAQAAVTFTVVLVEGSPAVIRPFVGAVLLMVPTAVCEIVQVTR